MTPEELKEIVNKKFNVDISSKSNKRHIVYAKKVYCHILRKLGYSYEHIIKTINMTAHRTAMHHVETINNIYKQHKILHNQIVIDYKLDVPLLSYKLLTPASDNAVFLDIQNMLLSLSEKELIELRETRLKPYIKMLNKN